MSAALEETEPGGPRSRGISYQNLLDTERVPVPEVLRWESARSMPTHSIPLERYTSREFHDLEVEKMWKKVWQMACREEDLPAVGSHVVYDIADISILVMRSRETEIKAFYNACLHRGRALRDESGKVEELKCPFHGWTWNIDGTLKRVTCHWDFPDAEREDLRLPEIKVGTWGGFVFINMDPECGPLSEFIGDLTPHFERWPLEDRYKAAHIKKVMRCNWKVAQEAFMEAYHVVATHPQLLAGIGDANSQYDVWENFSRAMTPNMTPSPNINWEPDEQEMLNTMTGVSMDADPMVRVPEGRTARQTLAQTARMQIQSLVPDAHLLTDAELVDSFYYTVFPNFHPWGAYNRIVYRFTPYGNDPDRCWMEVMYLDPFRGKRPPACPVHLLGEDDDWTEAPELGFLAKVFNQDTFNLPHVQKGLHTSVAKGARFGRYQECKLRHFHTMLERFIEA